MYNFTTAKALQEERYRTPRTGAIRPAPFELDRPRSPAPNRTGEAMTKIPGQVARWVGVALHRPRHSAVLADVEPKAGVSHLS